MPLMEPQPEDTIFLLPPWRRKTSTRHLDPSGKILKETLKENEAMIRKYNELVKLGAGHSAGTPWAVPLNTKDIKKAIEEEKRAMMKGTGAEGAQITPNSLEVEAIQQYDPRTDSRHDMIFGNVMGMDYGGYAHGPLWPSPPRAPRIHQHPPISRLGEPGVPSRPSSFPQGTMRATGGGRKGRGIWGDIKGRGALKEAALRCGAINFKSTGASGAEGPPLVILHRGGLTPTRSTQALLHETRWQMVVAKERGKPFDL